MGFGWGRVGGAGPAAAAAATIAIAAAADAATTAQYQSCAHGSSDAPGSSCIMGKAPTAKIPRTIQKLMERRAWHQAQAKALTATINDALSAWHKARNAARLARLRKRQTKPCEACQRRAQNREGGPPHTCKKKRGKSKAGRPAVKKQ